MAWLKISNSTELNRFQTDDIVFIHADGNYSDIALVNGKSRKLTLQLQNFDRMLQELDGYKFTRVGRSLIVNKNYIESISLPDQRLRLNSCQMAEEYDIKVSKEAIKTLKELMDKEGGKQ